MGVRGEPPMRRMLHALGLVVLVAGVALPAGAAHGQSAAVTCGMEVTTSVRLRADLHCAGDALVVVADDVTIDLGGHTLSGDGTGTGIVLRCGDAECPGRSFEVRRGTISGFAAGIDASGGRATVERVVFTGNGV